MAKSRNKPQLKLQRLFIPEWCERKKITQAEVARRSGYREPHISLMGSGKKGFSYPSLEKVAAALEIPIGFLFYHPDHVPLALRALQVPSHLQDAASRMLDGLIEPR